MDRVERESLLPQFKDSTEQHEVDRQVVVAAPRPERRRDQLPLHVVPDRPAGDSARVDQVPNAVVGFRAAHIVTVALF